MFEIEDVSFFTMTIYDSSKSYGGYGEGLLSGMMECPLLRFVCYFSTNYVGIISFMVCLVFGYVLELVVSFWPSSSLDYL